MLVLLLVLIVGGIWIAHGLISQGKGGAVKEAVMETVTRKIVEEAASAATGQNVDLDVLEEQMEPEDAQKLDRIIDKYAESGLVQEAAEQFTTGGAAAAAGLADQIDASDTAELAELYNKYAYLLQQ